jgi:hypothetical protein
LGAIRWDAYTGTNNDVGMQVEQALSPWKYHYRVPFFGIETDTGAVKIDGRSQSIMDQEIEFAKYAGLDYWAFVWYESSSGLDAARKFYYTSNKKSLIDYCLIVESGRFKTLISIDDIIHEFQDPSYFKVMNGRPLLYFLGYSGIEMKDIDSLRSKSAAAGTGNPYIVELRVDGNLNVVDDLHMDAFGMYATSWISHGVPYKDLADADMGQWNWVGKTSGKKVVPHITTGWDTRPIHDHPLSWYAAVNADDYVVNATPAEIANHITDAIDWVKSNNSIAEANTILIYAWNEHVEGGWICPTLANYVYTDRIDTLHKRFGKPLVVKRVEKDEASLKAFPNSTSDKLHLNIKDQENWTLKNLCGVELLKGTGSACDLSSLRDGIYLISAKKTNILVMKI